LEEEKLGLDENTKEILGMHDTDSEESESGSELSSTGDDRGAWGGFLDDKDFGEDDFEDAVGCGEPSITVQEALHDPIFQVSLQPEVTACIFCPGKRFKRAKMVEIHRISKACALPFLLREVGLTLSHLSDRRINGALKRSRCWQ
jgi:hypothetical protein